MITLPATVALVVFMNVLPDCFRQSRHPYRWAFVVNVLATVIIETVVVMLLYAGGSFLEKLVDPWSILVPLLALVTGFYGCFVIRHRYPLWGKPGPEYKR